MTPKGALLRRSLLRASGGLAILSLAPGRAGAVGNEVRKAVIEELVTANHILAMEGIVDAFGHISRRDPENRQRFLMSRSRAPGLIEAADIMEFDLSGAPIEARGRSAYLERFIHAAIYAARPDVNSIVHDHSEGILPFSVSDQPLRAATNGGGALGTEVPVWDPRENFGDNTNLLVTNLAMGQDLARKLRTGPAILIRGHGAVLAGPSIRAAVRLAIALEREARIQLQARQLGKVTYLSPGEVKATGMISDPRTPGDSMGRAWEHLSRKVGRPFEPKGY